MEYQKYINTLALMKLVTTDADTNQAWDNLYNYIHSNFPEPETAWEVFGDVPELRKYRNNFEDITSHAEIKDMLVMSAQSEQELIEKISSIPPVILETTFPVWIARYLLRFLRGLSEPRKLETFDEFHRRYGPMIVGSHY
jgi:hypothetical protein